MNALITQYNEIMKKLEIVNINLLDCRKAEPYYLDVLNFIKKHPDARAFFVKDFIRRLQVGVQPWELIQFCMRELQWPEIRGAAIKRAESTDDWRIISVMNDIIAVYEPNWEDSEFYLYYSNEDKK